MSSGRRTSVARPAQYAPSRSAGPTAARARAKSNVEAGATSSPAARNVRANATAIRSPSPVLGTLEGP